jgi:hypothetical protein
MPVLATQSNETEISEQPSAVQLKDVRDGNEKRRRN